MPGRPCWYEHVADGHLRACWLRVSSGGVYFRIQFSLPLVPEVHHRLQREATFELEARLQGCCWSRATRLVSRRVQ
jgi:hypothetical protein